MVVEQIDLGQVPYFDKDTRIIYGIINVAGDQDNGYLLMRDHERCLLVFARSPADGDPRQSAADRANSN